MSSDLAGWQDAVRTGIAGAGPRGGAFAQHVSVRHTTASTNDDVARAALEGAPEGYCVVAAEQTAGRGRRGASWHSPAAAGLYLSTLLRPERWAAVRADAASPVPSLVTLMAGVAVVSAIRAVCDAPVELKWPNDVMVRAKTRESGVGSRESTTGGEVGPVVPTRPGGPPWRKLAGILAEGATERGVLRTVVLGIGLNLSRSEAPTDVADRMIALDELVGPPPGRSLLMLPALVSALLVGMREGTDALARGDAEQVREQWQRYAPSVAGTPVQWQQHGEAREGVAVGIDDRGALRVRLGAGNEVLVHGGDVTWQLETEDP